MLVSPTANENMGRLFCCVVEFCLFFDRYWFIETGSDRMVRIKMYSTLISSKSRFFLFIQSDKQSFCFAFTSIFTNNRQQFHSILILHTLHVRAFFFIFTRQYAIPQLTFFPLNFPFPIYSARSTFLLNNLIAYFIVLE